MMVRITIDGQIVHVKRHTPVLEAAKQLEIFIPTLCYHKALKAYGACQDGKKGDHGVALGQMS